MGNINNISGNPFLQRSAEDELAFLSEIYYKPIYYEELKDNAISGASRMLIGQRGLGKSATIHILFKELQQNRTLPLLISRYDGIPLNDNEPYFLYKIMQSMSNGIAQHLFVNKKIGVNYLKINVKNSHFLSNYFLIHRHLRNT